MTKIAAEDVDFGQHIEYRRMYDRVTYHGIVVGIDVHADDPVNRITFTLWDWAGLDEVTMWEVEEVSLTPWRSAA